MRNNIRKILALVLALSLCVPAFALAEGEEAEPQQAAEEVPETPAEEETLSGTAAEDDQTDGNPDEGGDPDPDHPPIDPDVTVIAVEIVNHSETVDGDVGITDRDKHMIGLKVSESEGKAIEVTVNGDVTAQNQTSYNDHQDCTAVSIEAGRVFLAILL